MRLPAHHHRERERFHLSVSEGPCRVVRCQCAGVLASRCLGGSNNTQHTWHTYLPSRTHQRQAITHTRWAGLCCAAETGEISARGDHATRECRLPLPSPVSAPRPPSARRPPTSQCPRASPCRSPTPFDDQPLPSCHCRMHQTSRPQATHSCTHAHTCMHPTHTRTGHACAPCTRAI